ncbi:MAG TPA: hypothetical protein VFS22_08060, partial [Flavisolibacter sp.]|nr:hypothetical protein [Flavisolibacter sp.]
MRLFLMIGRSCMNSPAKIFRTLISTFLITLVSSQLYAQTDGNPADWQNIIANSQYIKINNPRVDKINSSLDDILGSGAKDVNDFPLWHYAINSANDKTDIQNAVIVLLSGHVVRFAADRFAQNGDAEIGIWLLKGPLSENPAPANTFTGQHTNGDVLITSKFTNGGTQPNITVRTWQNGVLSSAIVPPSGKAKVNSSTLDVPAVFQNFQSKFGALNKYPAGAFFEGELDLDDLGGDACFTRFLFETSQSQASTEALGDFLLGNFNTKPNPPSVTPAEKCYDGTQACATGDCGTNNGTLVFYNAATAGSIVQPCRTEVGTSTFYAACVSEGCESDRVPVTVTINENPSVQATVTVEPGITKTSDDLYVMKISTTNTAHLVAVGSKGTPPYTYEWSALDANAAVSFSTDASP